jgi:hypothetical protein
MSAKRQLATPETMLPIVDYPAQPAVAAKRDLKLVVDAQPPQSTAVEPVDPLAQVKALSEAERIALFS